MSDQARRGKLSVTGSHKVQPNLTVRDEVVVIVTQAFGPRGDNLVGISDVTFDGNPAVTLKLRADGKEGLIHLSPIPGDSRTSGFVDIKDATRCELFCPVSGVPLDLIGDVEDKSGARYYAIYLTPQLSRGSMVMVSDIWGHYHSRIIDDFELISAWSDGEES